MDNRSQFGLGEVGDGGVKPFDVVLHVSDGEIAEMTQEATDLTGGMIMVNMESNGSIVATAMCVMADGADATLRREHAVPFPISKSVMELSRIFSGCVSSLLRIKDAILAFLYNGPNLALDASAVMRLLCASWFMSNADIETIKFSTILAWLKDPSFWSRLTFSRGFIVWMLSSPLMVALKGAKLASSVMSVSILGGYRKLIHGEQFLTVYANFLKPILLWPLLAFVSKVPQEASDGHHLSAPGAGDDSLLLSSYSAHAVSIGEKLLKVKFVNVNLPKEAICF
jgi:hypothetical protein